MFGEVALDIDMEKFDHIFDARKKKAKAKSTPISPPTICRRSLPIQEAGAEGDGKPFRRTPASSSPCRATPYSAPGGTQGVLLSQDGKDSRRDRTAANVRRWSLQHGKQVRYGVGFTRDPATGEKVFWANF